MPFDQTCATFHPDQMLILGMEQNLAEPQIILGVPTAGPMAAPSSPLCALQCCSFTEIPGAAPYWLFAGRGRRPGLEAWYYAQGFLLLRSSSIPLSSSALGRCALHICIGLEEQQRAAILCHEHASCFLPDLSFPQTCDPLQLQVYLHL